MKNLYLFFLLTISTFCQAQLDSALVAYWPLDGNGKDLSGNNHSAQLTGSFYATSDRHNSSTCALAFAKQNEGLLVSSLPPTPRIGGFFWSQWYVQNTFALSLWFSPINKEQGTFIAFYFDGVLGKSFGYKGDTLVAFIKGRALKVPFISEKWNHFVLNWNWDGTINIVLNNTMIFNGTPFVDINNQNIGFTNLEDAYLGSGGALYMDDFRIYNRLLITSEISQLYNEASSCSLTTELLDSPIVQLNAKSISKVVNMSGQEIKDFENFRGLALVLYTDGTHKKVLK